MGTRRPPVGDTERPLRLKRWIRRGGIGLFLFFLLKGLAWLIVPALSIYFCSR